MANTRRGFEEAMDDDFNTAGALSSLYELVRTINQTRAENGTTEQLAPAQALLRELCGVFGLTLEVADRKDSAAADPFVQMLVELRLELRKQKLYALADQVRNQLSQNGVVLEDTKEGTTWRWQ
jgi:cysteinyl-tRNA synthetase